MLGILDVTSVTIIKLKLSEQMLDLWYGLHGLGTCSAIYRMGVVLLLVTY